MKTLEFIYILLGAALFLAIMAILGIVLVKKKGDKELEEEQYFNSSTNSFSRRGFAWRLGKSSAKVSVIAMEVDYGESSNDAVFANNVEKHAKQIVKIIKQEFQDNVIGNYGSSVFLIAVLRDKSGHIQAKMNKIKNNIIASNKCFNNINVIYGYCVDDATPSKLTECAIFTLKYAHIFNLNEVKYDKNVDAMKNDFERIISNPSDINKEFKLIYQPIVKAENGIIFGAEAKIIWVDGSGSLLYKAKEFYPEFVKNGISFDLDLFVLNEACSALEDLTASVREEYAIFVNIAGVNLLLPEFIEEAKKVISKHNINKNSLVISILETVGTEDVNNLMALKANAQSLGVKIEIRDFGNRGLTQSISNNIFDFYKLSSKFTATQIRSENEMSLLGGVVEIIEDINKKVVIEGVESAGVVRFVRNNSQEALLQGDFLFREMSYGKYKALLQSGAKSTEEALFNEETEKKAQINKVEIEPQEETILPQQPVVNVQPIIEVARSQEEVNKEEIIDNREDGNTITNIVILGIDSPFTFNQEQLEYTISVPYNTTSISFSVSYDGFKGKVVGDGQANLNIGNNFIYIYAVSEAGNKGKTYTFAVNRLIASSNNNASAIKLNGSLIAGFNSAVTSYNIKVPYETKVINLFAQAEDEKAKVVGNGDIFLSATDTIAEIAVQSEEGLAKKYIVTISKEEKEENKASQIVQQQATPIVAAQAQENGLEDKNSITNIELIGDLGKTKYQFNSNKKEYIISVPYSTKDITFAIDYDGAKGIIVGNGTRELSIGNNIFKAYAISESGKKGSEYTFTINREYASINNFLKELKVDGQLIAGFNKKTLTYKMNVGCDIDSVFVDAVAEDEKAVVNGIGQISLTPGSNIIAVYVTSEFGSSKTYMIVITKEEREMEVQPQIIERIVEKRVEVPVIEKQVIETPNEQKEETSVDEIVKNAPVKETIEEIPPVEDEEELEELDDADLEELTDEELENISDEDEVDQEEKIASLMEEFKKQFKNQWEQEMLKKYPELMEKHNERKRFAERVVKMSPETKEYYNKIKNEFMSYSDIKNVTKKFSDNFVYNKTIVGKIAVSGKSIKLYLPLDPSKYPNGQFPHKDESSKKSHAKTPFAMRMTSNLAVKRAMILIGDVAQLKEMKKRDDYAPKDYARGLNFQIKKK